jgi:hypothetical protein
MKQQILPSTYTISMLFGGVFVSKEHHGCLITSITALYFVRVLSTAYARVCIASQNPYFHLSTSAVKLSENLQY